MITFLYGAPAMFGIKYDMIATPMREDGLPTFRLMHYTFLFQVFVIMNLFNMWNCRMLPYEESKELNIFTRPFSNWWFIIVFFPNSTCSTSWRPTTGPHSSSTQLPSLWLCNWPPLAAVSALGSLLFASSTSQRSTSTGNSLRKSLSTKALSTLCWAPLPILTKLPLAKASEKYNYELISIRWGHSIFPAFKTTTNDFRENWCVGGFRR